MLLCRKPTEASKQAAGCAVTEVVEGDKDWDAGGAGDGQLKECAVSLGGRLMAIASRKRVERVRRRRERSGAGLVWSGQGRTGKREGDGRESEISLRVRVW